MSDVKQDIKFANSMTADKRNTNFAYLIKGKMDTVDDGFYPATSFRQATEIASGNIFDIVGNASADVAIDDRPIILVDDGSSVRFYLAGQSTEAYTAHTGTINAVAQGTAIPYVVDGDDIYSVQTGSFTLRATFPDATPNIVLGGYDGLYYWWLGDDMWRQLSGATPELVMSNIGLRTEVVFMDFFDDNMILYLESRLNDSAVSTKVLIWDKANTTFFKSRIVLKGEKLIAGGVVNNVPMLVTFVFDTRNIKEAAGYFKIYKWTGTKFFELNRIKSASKTVKRQTTNEANALVRSSQTKTANNHLVFAVDSNVGNITDDISENFMYKLYEDGSIQAMTIPVANGTTDNATVVATYQGAELYGVNSQGSDKAKVYWNYDDNDFSNDDYEHYAESTYITNFYTNPGNRHKLDCFSVTFEKLFNEEELEVYFRTSTKEGWTLLGTVTKALVIANVNKRIDQSGDIPLPMQIYQFTKMPDGTALPEFNEIQFKFISKKGFSVIESWFEYSYITRNTKR